MRFTSMHNEIHEHVILNMQNLGVDNLAEEVGHVID